MDRDLSKVVVDNTERFKSLEAASLNSAHEGVKALLLLNGAACIAILGFLATTISQPQLPGSYHPLVQGMMRSLVWFAIGAALSVFTALFSYLANQAYASAIVDVSKKWGRGHLWTRFAIACTLASLGFFGWGVYCIWCVIPL